MINRWHFWPPWPLAVGSLSLALLVPSRAADHATLADALDAARRSGRPVLLDFVAQEKAPAFAGQGRSLVPNDARSLSDLVRADSSLLGQLKKDCEYARLDGVKCSGLGESLRLPLRGAFLLSPYAEPLGPVEGADSPGLIRNVQILAATMKEKDAPFVARLESVQRGEGPDAEEGKDASVLKECCERGLLPDAKKLSKILKKRKAVTDVQCDFWTGVCHCVRGEYDKSLAVFQEIGNGQSDLKYQARLWSAKALRLQRDWTRALAALEEILDDGQAPLHVKEEAKALRERIASGR